MSFLTWRAIINRLPTDAKVARLGIPLSPTCYCCTNNNISTTLENTEHIFYAGEHAWKIWRLYAIPIGIHYSNINLKNLLQKWWTKKGLNPVVAYITRVLPMVICWELWRSRCNHKYELTKPSVYRSKRNITNILLFTLQSNFGRIKVENSWENINKFFDVSINHKTSIRVK